MRKFGVGNRVDYDSSKFYKRRLFKPRAKSDNRHENTVPSDVLDKIFNKTSASMNEIPDSSVHLMVTSPPYNVGKEYDDDMSLDEYLEFLRGTWREVHRVLVPGGRACININGLGRKPYIPMHSFVTVDMIDMGFLMRGEIIWDKGASVGASCAWGSWRSPSNPVLRDVHEHILIFSKDRFDLSKDGDPTITKDEFVTGTKSIWNIRTESATKVGHPAPFPVELPTRLINLYTFKNDIVLDPFMGSGSTAVACRQTGRHYIGYDTSAKYCNLARKRLDAQNSPDA